MLQDVQFACDTAGFLKARTKLDRLVCYIHISVDDEAFTTKSIERASSFLRLT